MDTVTHILVGAATAQLGFRRRLGRGATWAAAAAALVPDLDMLAGRVMSDAAAHVPAAQNMMIHRGLTHSLLMVPVFALPIAAAWWGLRRLVNRDAPAPATGRPRAAPAVPFGLLLLCVLAAGLTHPLLDWCTSYGTELFAPLTDARFALDVLPIIDLLFTSIVAATLLACFIARKVRRGEAGKATLLIGWAGVLLAAGYVVAGGVVRCEAIADARPLADGARIVRADAYPALGTILVWRTVLETDKEWIVARIRPLSRAAVRPRMETAPREAGPWIDRARELPRVRGFQWFAMGRVRATYLGRDGKHIVEFHDMRYGAATESVESLWSVIVTFDDAGRVLSIASRSPAARRDAWRILRETWQNIWEP